MKRAICLVACVVVLGLGRMLAAAEDNQVTKSFTPVTRLYVRTEPPGADVYVEGEQWGTSPQLVKVLGRPKKLTVTVELEGYEKETRVVKIDTGEIIRLKFTLKELPRPKRDPSSWKPAPRGEWFDVLAPVDLAKDRDRGIWERNGNELEAIKGWHARTMLPVQVEGSYDLVTEFTRVSTAGSKSVNVIFPVGQRACALVLGGWGESVHGLQTIDGREPTDQRNPASTRPGRLLNGRRYTALIGVRTRGDNVTIEVSLDGKLLIDWSGKQESLIIPDHWKLPEPKRPALGMNGCTVRFHAARFRLVSGKALVCPPLNVTDDSNIDFDESRPDQSDVPSDPPPRFGAGRSSRRPDRR